MEVDFERWAERPHGQLGSSERASQAEERGTCEGRKCEVLRKQQRREHRAGRKGGRGLEEERGSNNRLLGTGDEGPQETDCSLKTNGGGCSSHVGTPRTGACLLHLVVLPSQSLANGVFCARGLGGSVVATAYR